MLIVDRALRVFVDNPATTLGVGGTARQAHPHRTTDEKALLRARLVEDGVAFAISLRGNPRDAARPQVVAAALYRDHGSALEIPGEAVMAREADLAARIAAALQV